ncbi:unnamed protein product [Auanema sp. JU1783]|nr:unnamed protein product [Auanema sp. JU1783]
MQLKTLQLLLLWRIAVSNCVEVPLFDKSSASIPFKNYDCGRNIKVKTHFHNFTEVVTNNVDCTLDPSFITVLNSESESYFSPTTYEEKFGFSAAQTCSSVVYCKSSSNRICENSDALIYDFSKRVTDALDVEKLPQNATIYALDPYCVYRYRESSGGIISRTHRFNSPDVFDSMKNLGASGITVKSDGDDLYIKTNIIESLDENPRVLINDGEEPSFGTSELKQGNSLSWKNHKACNSWCDYGRMILFNITANSVFTFTLHLKKSCDWVALCTYIKESGIPSCEKFDTTHLFLKNDLVLFSSSHIAIPLKMQTGIDETDFSSIEITKLQSGLLAVTNSLRQRAINLNVENRNGKKLAFLFSDSTCLKEEIGIETTISNGYVSIQPGEDASKIKEGPVIIAGSVLTKAKVIEIPTTTMDPLLHTVPQTTTKSFLERNDILVDDDAAIVQRYSGWRTWALFYGFFTGSIAGCTALAIAFFLCRRTMYPNWYRGMYKRYGCDASMDATGEFGGSTIAESTIMGSAMGSAMSSAMSSAIPTAVPSAMSMNNSVADSVAITKSKKAF